VITNISLITLWVTNQDAARDFYTSKLGFTAKDDVKLGDGFRWVTITHPPTPCSTLSSSSP
jgi:catechol 2,3-dioxygenase-like lactoylglutathione lyase family enzyme